MESINQRCSFPSVYLGNVLFIAHEQNKSVCVWTWIFHTPPSKKDLYFRLFASFFPYFFVKYFLLFSWIFANQQEHFETRKYNKIQQLQPQQITNYKQIEYYVCMCICIVHPQQQSMQQKFLQKLQAVIKQIKKPKKARKAKKAIAKKPKNSKNKNKPRKI